MAQILVHLALRISVGGVCFCHLPRNMKSPNTSVTCRASHALSKLLLDRWRMLNRRRVLKRRRVFDRWRYTLDQPTVQASDQPSVHARPAERARNPWFCDGNHVLISYFLIENQVSASIFHTKTEGCRRWACDRAPSVRQTKTMAGGTEKRHRTMVFERKFMISTEFLTKTEGL